MSSVRTLRSVTNISPSAKCKCPTTVINRPSRRSKETRGTRIPSKYSSQQGNCWNLNFIELMKEEQRKPSRKWRDEVLQFSFCAITAKPINLPANARDGGRERTVIDIVLLSECVSNRAVTDMCNNQGKYCKAH